MGYTPVTDDYVRVPNDLLEFLRTEVKISAEACILVIEIASHRVGAPLRVSMLARHLGIHRTRIYKLAHQLETAGLLRYPAAKPISGGSVRVWSLEPMWLRWKDWHTRDEVIEATAGDEGQQ